MGYLGEGGQCFAEAGGVRGCGGIADGGVAGGGGGGFDGGHGAAAVRQCWRDRADNKEKTRETGRGGYRTARRRRPLSDSAAPLGAERRRRLACASRVECACGRRRE